MSKAEETYLFIKSAIHIVHLCVNHCITVNQILKFKLLAIRLFEKCSSWEERWGGRNDSYIVCTYE
jgi:hypothetical protein